MPFARFCGNVALLKVALVVCLLVAPGSAAPKRGDQWSQGRGNARSGALLPRTITALHRV